MKLACKLMVVSLALTPLSLTAQTTPPPPATPGAPVQLTGDQDHQRVLDQLHIASLRPGADHDPKSPTP